MPYKDKSKQKEYLKKYQNKYKADKPKSAISKYYDIYKEFEKLSSDEIKFLVNKKRNDLKDMKEQKERQRIKTEMRLLEDIYEIKKHEIVFSNNPEDKGYGYIYESEVMQRKNAVLPGTERINWKKAKIGWTTYYDDGLITLNPNIFFKKNNIIIKSVKSLKQIYSCWRHGYI